MTKGTETLRDALYRKVDDTTWPVNTGDTQWHLRYSANGDVDGVRLHAASIVAAYAHLTDPAITQREAFEALKRARRAAAA